MTSGNGYFSPCSTAYNFDVSKGKCYVKITKQVPNKFTFYCSTDSLAWKKVDVSTSGGYKYILLADSYANGNYTDYDFVKLTTEETSVQNDQPVRTEKLQGIYARAHGTLLAQTAGSGTIGVFDLRGICVYQAKVFSAGSHLIQTGITTGGNYVVRMLSVKGTRTQLVTLEK